MAESLLQVLATKGDRGVVWQLSQHAIPTSNMKSKARVSIGDKSLQNCMAFRPVGELQNNIVSCIWKIWEIWTLWGIWTIWWWWGPVSHQGGVRATYHKFFPLVASTQLVAIISAISLKYQRRQGTEAKWKKLITQEKRRKLAALPEMRVALAW